MSYRRGLDDPGIKGAARALHWPVAEETNFAKKVITSARMHPPLHKSKHPHCVSQIDDLESCHAENPIAKFWGVCNEAKWALDRCLREQKNLKRLQNKVANLEREERRQQRQQESQR